MIKINNLSVSFSDNKILKKINLEIADNEITIIVGQSGVGKSVLIKAITGLVETDSGSIIIDDVNIVHQSMKERNRLRRKMGMLFQNSALLDSYNVFRNIALPLFEHTKLTENEILQIVKEKLKLVGLENILEKMPSELSGGMKKRVALARAIILNPKYIFYDEPTTGLDPVTADEIIKLILKLNRELKITGIIITHDLNCIRKTAGNIKMLDKGKIIFDGNWSKFNSASDERIKNFIGNE